MVLKLEFYDCFDSKSKSFYEINVAIIINETFDFGNQRLPEFKIRNNKCRICDLENSHVFLEDNMKLLGNELMGLSSQKG